MGERKRRGSPAPRDAFAPKAGKGAASMFAEVGSSGLRRQGGNIFDHTTRDLRGGAQSAKCFQEMHDFLPVVRASVQIYQLLIRQASFMLEPADDSPEALKYRDFAKDALDDMEMDFGDVVSDGLRMLTYGWALQEEVYKVRRGPMRSPLDPSSKFSDGLVGWRKISLRSPRTLQKWEFTPNGQALGMWQLDPTMQRAAVLIPLDKCLLFTTEHAGGNPEGASLLASSWKFWTVLKRLIEREAIGLGRDLTGIPVMRVPPALLLARPTPDDRATLDKVEKLVTGLTAHEQASVIIPAAYDAKGNALWDFKLAGVENGAGRNFSAMGDTIARYEHRITTSTLTAFLMLGQDKVGTQALAENNSDMLLMAANAMADQIAKPFNRFGLPRLCRVNGWPEELAPIMVPSKVKRAPTLKELGDYLTALAGIGAQLFGEPDPEPAFDEPLDTPEDPADPNNPPADPEDPDAPQPEPKPKPKPKHKPTAEEEELLSNLLSRADITLPTKEL